MSDARLDRRGADRRAAPGDRRAAALFPRPRHRRGGVPGSLPARAEDLAAQRAAARSGRLADPGRPQRRARRRAPARPAAIRCRRTRRSPTSTTSRRRWPSGSTARTTATTCCGCCSSAAIRTCRRRSRSRWRCASSPGLTVAQIARAFLVERGGDGAAHHPRQGADRAAPTCRSRRRAPSSAPSASPPWRR